MFRNQLWLGAKEMVRLAETLDRLAKTYPGVAAKVYRALCMRIIDAGKSNHYHAALSNLKKARTCYEKAGLDAQWEALVAEIRREHRRKTGFMPSFERIVAGAGPSKEPSFLDRAKGRWAKGR